MNRCLNFWLCTITALLFFSGFSSAQSDKAVFHIQVFKSDSTIIGEGTGFFMDGNEGYAHAFIFKNGAFARVITQDSTIHRITNIAGFDRFTGVVRLELDNMLSTKITKLSGASTMTAVGSTVQVIHSDGLQSSNTQKYKVAKREEIIGYEPAIILEGALDKQALGAPVVNAAGQAVGMVIAADEAGRQMAIAGTGSIVNVPEISKTVAEFGASVQVQPFLIQGLNAYLSGDTEQAISALGKAKSAMPGHVTAYYYAGLLNYSQDKISAARADMSKAIELDNTLAQAFFIRGKINFGNDDFSNAAKDLDQAEALGVGELVLYEMRGKSRYNSKDLEGAMADFERCGTLGSKDAEIFYLMGNSKFRNEDFAGAVAAYNKSNDLGRTDELIYNNRGKAKYLLKDMQGAIADYTKSIDANPEYDKAYINRGTCYFEMGDFTKALASLTMAGEMGASSTKLFTMLGLARFNMKDMTGAMDDLNTAIRMETKEPKAYWYRGSIKNRRVILKGHSKTST
ncbi:MAG: hypothetical protein HC819_03785 [Cyclobacteriaceae bacterium]|nr:hypothetical protein [Cyclobacteriaceae bacterium]